LVNVVLLHGAPADGAVERYVVTLALALGDDCVLIHPGLERFEELGVPTVVVEHPRVATLARLVRAASPDLVHVTDVWPQAVVAARLARVRRLLVTHHTPELPRNDNLAGRAWQRLAWALRPEVIYTSEADRRRDRRRPSQVIPLGIDLDLYRSEGRVRRAKGPVVGSVGRLAPQKDHATLLEAAALLPEVELVLVGDGPERPALERRAEELGLRGRVAFLGRRSDVPVLLPSFDVYVQSSRYEGLCLAVLEAQAAGVPVVATPVGGIRDTVVDGETGLLVPVGDPAAVAAAIRRLLDDRPLASELAAAAQESVSAFSLDLMVERTLELYGYRGRRPNAINVSAPDA
jgi:glycosyltransferase involved in cell wall biosynthesis